MTYFRTTIDDLLKCLSEHDWRHWVYVSDAENIDCETTCFVIDTDNVPLDEDGFTPVVATRNGLQEFLSVEDIQMIREYLGNVGIPKNQDAELFSIRYYFEKDAYPPEEALRKFK